MRITSRRAYVFYAITVIAMRAWLANHSAVAAMTVVVAGDVDAAYDARGKFAALEGRFARRVACRRAHAVDALVGFRALVPAAAAVR